MKSLLSLAALVAVTTVQIEAQDPNLRPVIGVLSQQTSTVASNASNFDELAMYRLMIPASYVKWIGQGGGRVLPILLGRTRKYYEDLFAKINGILFPGGNQGIDPDDIYTREGEILWNLAKSANENGDYFPIWGTCLGFEELAVLETGNGDVISLDVNATNLALPLNLTPAANSSRLFGFMEPSLVEALATENITMNSHSHGLLLSEYENNTDLNSFFTVTSTNVAPSNGAVFVSTMEATSYPFYGTQWHPEKNNFEWSLGKEYTNIPHSYSAVLASQETASFFLQEARKSSHVFPEDEQETLIYSATLLYTGPNWIYEQVYAFDMKGEDTDTVSSESSSSIVGGDLVANLLLPVISALLWEALL